MVLGFDGFDGLRERLGANVADEVSNRFAKMLAGKMRQEDSLGHYSAGQFSIISPGTAPAFCATFAERVREAVEVARLSVQGETVALTVSIGLASVPTDRVSSAGALLDMAGERMQAAMLAGEIEPSRAEFCRLRGRFQSITHWNCWPPIGRRRSFLICRRWPSACCLCCG